jgi:hypothetical protein
MRGEFPRTPIEVATRLGRVTVIAGVDTYAGITACSLEWARDHGFMDQITPAGELYAADNQRMSVIGEISISVKLPDQIKWVKTEVAVLETWGIPHVSMLLGANVHSQLGRTLEVDLNTGQSRYYHGFMQSVEKHNFVKNFEFSDVCIELPDFTIKRTEGTWGVSWKWSEAVPPTIADIPQGPSVYKSRWITENYKEIAFQELKIVTQ